MLGGFLAVSRAPQIAHRTPRVGIGRTIATEQAPARVAARSRAGSAVARELGGETISVGWFHGRRETNMARPLAGAIVKLACDYAESLPAR